MDKWLLDRQILDKLMFYTNQTKSVSLNDMVFFDIIQNHNTFEGGQLITVTGSKFSLIDCIITDITSIQSSLSNQYGLILKVET